MTYHPYDQPGSTFGSYKKINDHYETEISLVRMDRDYNLKKDSGGDLCFDREMTRWEGDDSVVTSERVITYKESGEIYIDIPEGKKGYRYGHNRDRDTVLGYLPDCVGMYETSSNEKRYLLYDPDCNVRSNSYSPQTVWDITKSKRIELSPNGSVKGAKRVDRGEKKFADNKPLDEQLEEKHYREMMKARMKSDLEIDYTNQYASFRGCSTGLFHYCLEMYRPSTYGHSGPNSGLIRRLFVGRFMDNKDDGIKCKELALSIIKDLPDSCLSGSLKGLRGEKS